jgi:hypothetical protein
MVKLFRSYPRPYEAQSGQRLLGSRGGNPMGGVRHTPHQRLTGLDDRFKIIDQAEFHAIEISDDLKYKKQPHDLSNV